MERLIEYQKAANQIKYKWWSIVLGVPLMGSLLLGVRNYKDFNVSSGYQLDLSATEFWSIAIALMAAGAVGARVAGSYFLDPVSLAKRSDQSDVPEDASLVERAKRRIIGALFIQLGILDFPAVSFLIYSLLFGGDLVIIVGISHCLLCLLILQPDADRLLRATVLEMQRMEK